MRKIAEAELLSKGHTKLKLTLTSGKVILGYSLGKVPAYEESEEELDIDVVAIEAAIADAYFRLKDRDIAKVEAAS